MSRYGYGITPAFLQRFVTEVVSSRAPEKSVLMDKLIARSLSPREREELRGVLAAELVENGMGPEDEPNGRGIVVEAAISWLGHQ